LPPSPAENGQNLNDTNLKPEAEQTQNDNDPDIMELSSSNMEREEHLQGSSETKEVVCLGCRAEHTDQCTEGSGGKQPDVTEDELNTEEVGTDMKEEMQCCQGRNSVAYTDVFQKYFVLL
jgi:hypothetical protein